MRYLTLAAVLVLAAGAALIPQAAGPGHLPSVSVERPAVAVCSVEEGSGRSTTVSVLSTVDGKAQLTLFDESSLELLHVPLHLPHCPLGLGHDLVGDDQHITIIGLEVV